MMPLEEASSGHANGAAGGKLCPLDSKVEDNAHVFRHCFFSAFMFDTV